MGSGRADALLAAYEPALTSLGPTVRRLAETFDPHEVEALVSLIDRLPAVLDQVDRTVLPLLTRLGPDVHEILDTVKDLRQVLAGLPGVGFLRRRANEDL